MQLHLDRYRPGNPAIADAHAALPPEIAARPSRESVDVMTVGSGATGLTVAAQLAAFPEISVCLAEAKSGATPVAST